MISLIVIVIMIREIHDSWALMIVIIPKEVAESHRFTITTTFMARPRRPITPWKHAKCDHINLDKHWPYTRLSAAAAPHTTCVNFSSSVVQRDPMPLWTAIPHT